MLIEGGISIKACINAKKRNIEVVYIDANKKTKDFNYIRKLMKTNNINYKEISRDEFANFTSGKTHGGIIAMVNQRKDDEFDDGDIFYLDGIEDPFNIGYILRTLYAFGVKNVFLPLRDYSNFEGQILKSSAGAYEMMNIKFIDKAEEVIKEYKEKGYTTYALKRGEDAIDMFEERFSDKAFFLLGGEKRGISSSLIEMCDRYLYIPYGSDFRNSLNAAGASDVVATLLFAQRKHD